MLGEGTIGGGCRMEVVAMAVAIEEGTGKRVRQVKTAIGEWGCWWLGYARRRGCCSSGLEGESARSYMVTVTVNGFTST